jgi:hypothetical protein
MNATPRKCLTRRQEAFFAVSFLLSLLVALAVAKGDDDDGGFRGQGHGDTFSSRQRQQVSEPATSALCKETTNRDRFYETLLFPDKFSPPKRRTNFHP